MKKHFVTALAAFLGACCLFGCENAQPASGDGASQEETQTEIQEAEESEEEEPETKEENRVAILVVSFGTSYNDNRDATIGAIEKQITEKFPEYDVRRAFTSQIIIDKLKKRDNLEIDNVTEALDRAVADGIKELVLQPTHLMNGYEYNDILKELTPYVDKFDKVIVSDPLLADDADFEAVAEAITERTSSYDDGKTAVCFMGHGTEADSNAVYPKMQEVLSAGGYENYYIGTVEAEPTLEDLIAALKEKGGYEKVVLEPLMVVAGDHANNDMAGDEDDSWKTILTGEGYEVECILEGLGQIPAIRDIYVEHLQSAIEKGDVFTGISDEASVAELENGTYEVEVESSSSMFNITKAELTVADDGMSAVITLGGKGYSHLYMGTASDAENATEDALIPFNENAEGAYTYTVPVSALDIPIDCAALSKKKGTWYDRQITFRSDTAKVLSKETESIKDGNYTIELTFAGGSGRAVILSPAAVTVAEESITAVIQWNSPNYDYMVVDGEKYFPVNTDGNSVFEIPIASLDKELTVIGDTVAMSKPHEIEYTLIFHSDTMKPEKESADRDSMKLAYAENFSVDYYEGGYTLLTTLTDGKQFLITPEGMEAPEGFKEGVTILHRPVENIYLVASSAMDMFSGLKGLDVVSLSGQKADGWYIDDAKEAMQKGKILYAGKYNKPDYELIASKGCSLAIENTMISHAPEVVEKLEEFHIPVMIDYSSYESHPLGRVEWIKFYGALLGKETEAERLFEEQEKILKQVASAEKTGKTAAFFYITSNGLAQVRQSSDYIPKMIELAGGRYIFEDLGDAESKRSTVNMQLEEFYNGAKDADFLIYNSSIDGGVSSVKELLGKSRLLEDFKAVQKGNVWCTTNDMYQQSMSIGYMIEDMHRMFTGKDEENMRYLFRLK